MRRTFDWQEGPQDDLVRVCPYDLRHLRWRYFQKSFDAGTPLCRVHGLLRQWLVVNVVDGTVRAVGRLHTAGHVFTKTPYPQSRQRPNATKRWLLRRGRKSSWL